MLGRKLQLQIKKEPEKISKNELISFMHDHQTRCFKLLLKLDEVTHAFEKEIEEYDNHDECVYITDRILKNYEATEDLSFVSSENQNSNVTRRYVPQPKFVCANRY